MEGDLRRPILPLSPDRATIEGYRNREFQESSDVSGLTGGNSRNFVENDEIASPDIQMAESMSTVWTDEKHSLYLNSIEALFVKQLHNHDYNPMDLVGWHSKKENQQGPNSLRQLKANSRNSSDQFKVLRGGCWQKINFEGDQPQLDTANEPRVLLKNSWIRHFRSVGKRQDIASLDVQENNNALCGAAIIQGGKKTISCEEAASSKHLPVFHPHLCYNDSVSSSTEMSDQNFVDEDHEKYKPSSLSRTKRKKNVVAGASSKDQVVPLGMLTSTENYDSVGKERIPSDKEA